MFVAFQDTETSVEHAADVLGDIGVGSAGQAPTAAALRHANSQVCVHLCLCVREYARICVQ